MDIFDYNFDLDTSKDVQMTPICLSFVYQPKLYLHNEIWRKIERAQN